MYHTMEPPPSAATLFECASCGNLALGRREIVCCDAVMDPAREEGFAVDRPSLDEVLRTVFDMSESELDICLCVMAGGEQTVADLAATVEYDRSVVSRHLNHLVDLGVVEKRRRLLKEGGQVFVYLPRGPETVRTNLMAAFVVWIREATARIDGITREKVEAVVDRETSEPQWKIYQE